MTVRDQEYNSWGTGLKTRGKSQLKISISTVKEKDYRPGESNNQRKEIKQLGTQITTNETNS